MTLHPLAKQGLVLGTSLLLIAVVIGAFGAHGLKNIVTPEKLVTFETGVRYHFYHGFGILFLAITQHVFQALNLRVSLYAFAVGIVLFSFNCYFYAISDIKVFAMIVPVGGFLFILGWLIFLLRVLKLR